MLIPLFACLLALAPSAARATDPGSEASKAALERALDTVRVEGLSADVHFLADDAMGGRDTPSEGLRLAARFIRARLQRLDFRPGAEHGWFHTYPLELNQIDADGSGLAIEGRGALRALAFGSDYFPWARRIDNTTTSGAVTFVGQLEEFDGLDLTGRWAYVLEGKGSLRRRGRALQAAGAIGMLVEPGPDYDEEPYAQRFERSMERMRTPSVAYPRGARSEEGGGEGTPFSTVYLASAAAAGLVPEGAVPGADLGLTVTETMRRAGSVDGRVEVENVAGFWPGDDPLLQREVIIVSAHYDHVGQRPDGRIFNGADDNASGSCGLLAIAEALRAYGPLKRSVLLLWVSGEEKGLWGSQAWTEAPWLPDGAVPFCNINIDMIGRNAPDHLLVTPTAEHEAFNGLSRVASALAPQEGFPSLGSADEYWSRSDHRNFHVNLKIPVTFLFADVHEDYHKETDTPDKIDYDKVRRIVRLVVRMLDALQSPDVVL
ncbi:MAG TPA: M28 family peptidase [Planctomycetota bacterium]|nr:M28 family peptidase [Planctomycetota bacterium]